MQLDIRNHGNLPRELDSRKDKIMSILSNHPLEKSVMGVEIIYSSFKGEAKTVICNYYFSDGWFFA
jgi:hypothetical protein